MQTWKDIVAEMREVSGDETVNEIVITKRDWLTLADRIETEVKAMEDVNAKLRSALEPVMEAIRGDTSLTDAVRKAQAIMKEGAE